MKFSTLGMETLFFIQLINVDRSKTDQPSKGNEVVISESPGTPSCRVKILRRYLSKVSPYNLDSGHYIFRSYGFGMRLA